MKQIGLIGDHNFNITSHRAIPIALKLASQKLGIKLNYEWIPTETIQNASPLIDCDGLWCTPGSPYRNMEGVLYAIKYARENKISFLGTCGGFQHTILEFTRNVLGWENAEHAETTPNAVRPVISPLSCPLVDTTDVTYFTTHSKIAAAYGQDKAEESFGCRYGLNPAFAEELFSNALKAVGHNDKGEVRAVELTNHPFFVATLFQLERSALHGKIPPLVAAFLQSFSNF